MIVNASAHLSSWISIKISADRTLTPIQGSDAPGISVTLTSVTLLRGAALSSALVVVGSYTTTVTDSSALGRCRLKNGRGFLRHQSEVRLE